MYSTRFNQSQSTPSIPSLVVASTRDQYFDSSSCEFLDGADLDNMDWDSFPTANSIMPVCPTAETTLNTCTLPWSFDLLAAGPQMSFDEIHHVQSVEVAAVTPNTASSSFSQGAGHVDAFLLSNPAALVTSVSQDSKEATPVYDTPGMSSVTDSGKIASNTIDKPRFDCQVCGKSYGRLASLTRHIQAKHNSVAHLCSYCDKTYDRYDNMKRHEKTHRKANHSPSNGRATQLQSPSIRPTGITKSQRGGRVPTRSSEQEESPQLNPARAQRAMQLMGELFLIMSGSTL